MTASGGRFYVRWVVANAWSEGLGLGGTLLLAYLLAGGLATRLADRTVVLLGAVLAVLLGTLLEGVLVGWAQGRVLAARTPNIPVRDWTLATAIGAGIAWTLGMLPSTLMALLGTGAPATPSADPPAGVMLLLAAAMGLLLGPVLALAQWRVLRRAVGRPGRWLLANAAAWSLGMVLVFAGMDQVGWAGNTPGIVLDILLTCTLAGAAVGAVHGRVLQRMLAGGG